MTSSHAAPWRSPRRTMWRRYQDEGTHLGHAYYTLGESPRPRYPPARGGPSRRLTGCVSAIRAGSLDPVFARTVLVLACGCWAFHEGRARGDEGIQRS